MTTISKSARKYLSEIGKRGGKSGKGTQWRREACKHAAIARWRAYREKQARDAEQKELEAEKIELEKQAILDSEAGVHDIVA